MTTPVEPYPLYTWINRLPRWLLVSLMLPLIGLDGWIVLQAFHYFQSILSALVLATVLAFLLGYPVQFLQKKGVPRYQAVLLVFLLALVLIAMLAVTLVPIVVTQVEDLLTRLPDLLSDGKQQLQTFQDWAAIRRLPINVNGLINRLEQLAPEGIESASLQLPGFVLEAADGLLGTILVVALTLYLMLYGQAFWQSIFRWLPQLLRIEIQQSLQQNFQNYFVGQAMVALIEGVVLSLVFFLLKLPLFLIAGMGIGLLALIPFCDILGVVVVSLLTALSNVWMGVGVFALCLVIDQIVDNAISPRIMGKLVGLNPVWIILSLLLGVQIAGFVGIILAIPLASTIGDIINFFDSSDSSPDQLQSELEPSLVQTRLATATKE